MQKRKLQRKTTSKKYHKNMVPIITSTFCEKKFLFFFYLIFLVLRVVLFTTYYESRKENIRITNKLKVWCVNEKHKKTFVYFRYLNSYYRQLPLPPPLPRFSFLLSGLLPVLKTVLECAST